MSLEGRFWGDRQQNIPAMWGGRHQGEDAVSESLDSVLRGLSSSNGLPNLRPPARTALCARTTSQGSRSAEHHGGPPLNAAPPCNPAGPNLPGNC